MYWYIQYIKGYGFYDILDYFSPIMVIVDQFSELHYLGHDNPSEHNLSVFNLRTDPVVL